MLFPNFLVLVTHGVESAGDGMDTEDERGKLHARGYINFVAHALYEKRCRGGLCKRRAVFFRTVGLNLAWRVRDTEDYAPSASVYVHFL
ncbi:hypothetical protein B0H17DRAFT_347969 [Mycena rosella]|uniref:Uncharacterized protein n=1 Tax=Mycena rosella TaxID=1033263 RepID=A0AAD7GJE6_MYCRO|nr:hypothetical protein B0H17DRAFT_347969 [Mycena rosella]